MAARYVRPTAKQVDAALSAQAPPASAAIDYPVTSANVGWTDLDAELPRLFGWMTENQPELLDLADRIRIGMERRMEAIANQADPEVLEAIDDRLAEYRVRIGELDYGAKRALVIHALLYLRQLAGPCAVGVSAHGGTVEISVR
jgi:hypothetical protein